MRGTRGGGWVPEDVRGDDELIAVEVVPELRQVVDIRQLLPEFVAGRGRDRGGGEVRPWVGRRLTLC